MRQATFDLHATASRGPGSIGHPEPHFYFYFDRSQSMILSAVFTWGLVLDALEDLAFTLPEPDVRLLGWSNFNGYPAHAGGPAMHALADSYRWMCSTLAFM